jgi:hypothetical protein
MSEPRDGGPAFPTDSERQVGPDTWHYEGLSLRTYAAIKLRVPDSGIDWLDDMIRQAKRNEFAKQVMASLFRWANQEDVETIAGVCYRCADAMLAAREGQ